jgi:hypothetical protein
MADFNAWMGMLTGMNGNQQNPKSMMQMANQASPTPIGEEPSSDIPFFLRDPGAAQPPPSGPKIVPPPPTPQPLGTAQPTTSALGTLPQEMVPQQPALAGQQPQINPYDLMMKIDALKPRDNSAMMHELRMGEKSRNEAQIQHLSEIDKLKAGLAKYAGESRGIDFSPLAAFADSLSPNSHLREVAMAMAPESAAQKTKNMQEMQAKIAQMQGEIPGQELEALKNKLAQMGYMDERQNKLEIAKIMAEAKLAGSSAGQGRAGTAQDRLALQATTSIHNDEIIKQTQKQIAQMAIDRHTIETAKEITPQMLDEIQKGIANAISGGRSASVSDTEHMRMTNLETEYAKFMQKVKSKQIDVNAPEMKQYLRDVIERLDEGYKINAYARAQQKEKGSSSAFMHTPHAVKAMHEAVESYNPANMKTKHYSSGGDLPDNFDSMSDEEITKLYNEKFGGK